MPATGVDQLRHAEVREALRHLGVAEPPVHRAGAIKTLREILTGIGAVRSLLDRAPDQARSAFVRLSQEGPASVEQLLGRGWWGHGLLPEPLDWLQRRALVGVDDRGQVYAVAEAQQGFAALTLDIAEPAQAAPAQPHERAASGLQVSSVRCVVVADAAADLDHAVGVAAAGLEMVAPTVAVAQRTPAAVKAALRDAGVALADDVQVTAVEDRPALPGTTEEAVGPRAVRRLLERAVDEQRQVRLQYFASSRGGAATDRVVDPWAFRDDLLRGWCHLRTGERTFAVDRMGRVWLLPDPVVHTEGA